MISTVTTSTVTTVTILALGGGVAIVGIIVLLVMLVQKELASASSGKQVNMLGRALNIGIIPLLFAFVLVVASKVMDVLH